MALTRKNLSVLDQFPFEVALQVATPTSTLFSYGPNYQNFRWASVTKIAATLAIMVAVQEGDLKLEDPGGPKGSTLRHLIAHTSGLSFDTDTVLAKPGRRRIYSNRNIEVAANLAQQATSTPFPQWLESVVLMPLGMSATTLEGSPAYGITGTIDDLTLLGQELLTPTILTPRWDHEYVSPQFPGLTGVLPGFGRQKDNLWGLGVEIRGHKSPHWTAPSAHPTTFGHFGQSGSFLWVDRTRGVCAAFLGQERFGEIHAQLWPQLNEQILQNL